MTGTGLYWACVKCAVQMGGGPRCPIHNPKPELVAAGNVKNAAAAEIEKETTTYDHAS